MMVIMNYGEKNVKVIVDYNFGGLMLLTGAVAIIIVIFLICHNSWGKYDL